MDRLAAVLLALAAAHPGHDGSPSAPGREVAAIAAEVHTPSARLARSLLERGQAGLSARLVARDAAGSAEAARVLAEALEELGDPVGARLARERADRLSPGVDPGAGGRDGQSPP